MTAPPRTSRTGRTLILVLAVAAAGLLVARWSTQPGPEDEALSRERLDPPAAAAPAWIDGSQASSVQAMPGAPAAASAPMAAARRTPVVRGASTAGRHAFEQARNLGSLYNVLHTQADPDAQFFALRALRDCLPFVRDEGSSGELPSLDRYRPAPAGDQMTPRREAAFAALEARCDGFVLGGDARSAVQALRNALIASGGSRAALEQMALEVRGGADPRAVMDKARELTATGDPYTLEQVGALVASMRGRYVFMLDGELVRPDIVAAGWMMAACDAGRDCGQSRVEAPCAFLAECDAQDLETSLARYQLTPADFDRMQRLRARVTQGVAMGQWDPALFAPQAQPPWYRR